MRTSFCIYRLINCQNTGYNYQIWAIGARNELLGVILSDGGFQFPALFSLLMPTFRGRNQRFIKKCTLLWTIAGYRPQYEVSSKVSQNNKSRALHNFTSQPWSFAGGESFKYGIVENRLLRRRSSLFLAVLFRDVVFSHVPNLLPSNTIFLRFNIVSPLLFLFCDRESRQKTYIKINTCHFIGKSPSDITCIFKNCSNAFRLPAIERVVLHAVEQHDKIGKHGFQAGIKAFVDIPIKVCKLNAAFDIIEYQIRDALFILRCFLEIADYSARVF